MKRQISRRRSTLRGGDVRRLLGVLLVASAAALLPVSAAACGEEEMEGIGGGPEMVEVMEADADAGAGAFDDADAVEATRAVALRTVKQIAEAITPEMGKAHERLVKKGERSGADYRMWREFLEPLRAEYGLTALYTMVRIDGQAAGMVVESAEYDADEWMAEYEMERAMKRAFKGRPAVRQEAPWFDPRIRGGAPHVRALAPIVNAEGDVVAVVGLDIEVGERGR
jgi:hypothetical protein